MKAILLASADAQTKRFADALRQRGYPVVEHARAAPALDWCLRARPSVIIVDDHLSEMSAHQFLSSASWSRLEHPLRVVRLTSTLDHVHRDLRPGLTVFCALRKPVALVEFVAQVDSAAAARPTTARPASPPDSPDPCQSRYEGPSRRDHPPHSPQRVMFLTHNPQLRQKARRIGEQTLIDITFGRDPDDAIEHATAVQGLILDAAALAPPELGPTINACSTRAEHLRVALLSREAPLSYYLATARAGASLLLQQPIDTNSLAQTIHELAWSPSAPPRTIALDPRSTFVDTLLAAAAELKFTVQHVVNPRPLFERLEETQPSAIFLTSDLPDLSAFDLCRALRASPRWRNLPLILFSPANTELLRTAGFGAGADDVIPSDVSCPELAARIGARLRRSRRSRRHAERDSLTGVLARHAFLKVCATRLAEARRHRRAFSLCLLDLDHFKQVNDTHGHPVGDRVLSRLGGLMLDRFRAEDLRGRWGGEEFVVGLVGEPAPSAACVMDRLLREFRQIRFQDHPGTPFQMSFSAGIATFPDDGGEAEHLLRVADERLYDAKRAGRSRIHYRSPTRS